MSGQDLSSFSSSTCDEHKGKQENHFPHWNEWACWKTRDKSDSCLEIKQWQLGGESSRIITTWMMRLHCWLTRSTPKQACHICNNKSFIATTRRTLRFICCQNYICKRKTLQQTKTHCTLGTCNWPTCDLHSCDKNLADQRFRRTRKKMQCVEEPTIFVRNCFANQHDWYIYMVK